MSLKARRIRGFAAERELAYRLWRAGYAVLRAPASGSKVARVVYPDVLAVKDGRVLVFEVKTLARYKAIYIYKQKIDRLAEFARRAGGEAYVAVKLKDISRWFFVPVDTLRSADGGFYAILREQLDGALSLEDLLRAGG